MGLDARKLVFGGLRTTKAQSDQCLCYPLLETRNIQFSSYNSQGCIFNIESGQNVNRPVSTRGNIGNDAAPYVASTPILRRLTTCDEIFRRLSHGKQTSAHLPLGQDEAILTPKQRFDVALASILRRFIYVMRKFSFFH